MSGPMRRASRSPTPKWKLSTSAATRSILNGTTPSTRVRKNCSSYFCGSPIERTRRQLVEEGFEAVLRRKYNPNSARPRIFDGVPEAKLIALTLSPAPEGFARWSLRLLEEKVVELHIVERASDNTIGRTLKKTFSNRIASSNG